MIFLSLFFMVSSFFQYSQEIFLLDYQEKDVKKYCYIGIKNSEKSMEMADELDDYRFFEGKRHAYREILQVISN